MAEVAGAGGLGAGTGAGAGAGAESAGHAEALVSALRAQGAHAGDPVRFRFIESLARRTGFCEGPARRLLEDRVAALLVAYQASLAARSHPVESETGRGIDASGRDAGRLGRGVSGSGSVAASAGASAGAGAGAGAAKPLGRGPLAELVAHAQRQHPARAPYAVSARGRADTDAGFGPAPESTSAKRGITPAVDDPSLGESTTLQYFRRTWSRLSADQRLAQSRSSLPENAGPLNSHQLVHRSLALMRELSPEYFDRFIAHVDALLWVERVNEGGSSPSAPIPRAGARKAARGR